MIPLVSNLPPRPPEKPTKFNLRLARILSEYASRAYDPTPAARMKRGMVWSVFIDSPTTDARVLMECTGKEIVISFRGTTKKLEDWMQDLKCEMVTLIGADPDVKVHIGFDEDVNSLWAQIIERLDRYQMPIFITGHSRGAGDAAEFGGMLGQFSKYDIHTIYLFACPRCGNGNFKHYYNSSLKLKPITYRVVAQGDIVPHVPTLWQGYRHVGNEAYFTNDGRYKINPLRWIEIFKNEKLAAQAIEKGDFKFIEQFHSIDNYVNLIQNCLDDAGPKTVAGTQQGTPSSQ